VILVNSIFLAFVGKCTYYCNLFIDYTNENANTLGNRIVTKSEPIFTAIFTGECLIKIIAMGFIFDRKCYLRDAWNWLDFIVVVTAIIGLFTGSV
jgi:hypothetical protein